MIRKADTTEMIIIDFIQRCIQNARGKQKNVFSLTTYKLYD